MKACQPSLLARWFPLGVVHLDLGDALPECAEHRSDVADLSRQFQKVKIYQLPGYFVASLRSGRGRTSCQKSTCPAVCCISYAPAWTGCCWP